MRPQGEGGPQTGVIPVSSEDDKLFLRMNKIMQVIGWYVRMKKKFHKNKKFSMFFYKKSCFS